MQGRPKKFLQRKFRKENCRGSVSVFGSFIAYNMHYETIVEGKFLSRPNRFIAQVEINGQEETVHVKNTGRCKELLLPGARVYLERAKNPARKTAYDLIGVYKEGLGLVNMDSQAANVVVEEWLTAQKNGQAASEITLFSRIERIKPEHTFGKSRIDFFFEADGRKCLMEVKGVTLEREKIAYFPDAPTERGVKHIQELEAALGLGYECYVAFVIQMPGITEIYPNDDTHAAFGAALRKANKAGVKVLALGCEIGRDSLEICGVRRMYYGENKKQNGR